MVYKFTNVGETVRHFSGTGVKENLTSYRACRIFKHLQNSENRHTPFSCFRSHLHQFSTQYKKGYSYSEKTTLWVKNCITSVLKYLHNSHTFTIYFIPLLQFFALAFPIYYKFSFHHFVFGLPEDGRSFYRNMHYKLGGVVVFLKCFTCIILKAALQGCRVKTCSKLWWRRLSLNHVKM